MSLLFILFATYPFFLLYTFCQPVMHVQKIVPGEQLLYDYGEHDEAILKKNPWLQAT